MFLDLVDGSVGWSAASSFGATCTSRSGDGILGAGVPDRKNCLGGSISAAMGYWGDIQRTSWLIYGVNRDQGAICLSDRPRILGTSHQYDIIDVRGPTHLKSGFRATMRGCGTWIDVVGVPSASFARDKTNGTPWQTPDTFCLEVEGTEPNGPIKAEGRTGECGILQGIDMVGWYGLEGSSKFSTNLERKFLLGPEAVWTGTTGTCCDLFVVHKAGGSLRRQPRSGSCCSGSRFRLILKVDKTITNLSKRVTIAGFIHRRIAKRFAVASNILGATS